MSWTYSGNPAGSARDKVRFLLGDTTNTTGTLTNEEIDYLLTEAAQDPAAAAVEGAHALAARYSAMSATSKKIGDLSISYEYGETAARFTALAARLVRKTYGLFTPVVSTETEAEGVFSIGMDDYAE